MNDEPKFRVTVSGGTFTNSQIAIGERITQTMANPGAAATSRLSPAELDELKAGLEQLIADARTQTPDDRRDAALQHVEALAGETVGADEPDVGRIARIGRWFAQNAPELAGAVTTLILGPQVGALVGKASGLASALFATEPDKP